MDVSDLHALLAVLLSLLVLGGLLDEDEAGQLALYPSQTYQQ
jgi:hypothetical protein